MCNFINYVNIYNFKTIKHCDIKACKRINLFIARSALGISHIVEALSLFSHDLRKLIKFDEELNESFERLERENDPEFTINWAIVKDWSEQSRYKMYDENQAKELINAILNKNGGILPWVQQYW